MADEPKGGGAPVAFGGPQPTDAEEAERLTNEFRERVRQQAEALAGGDASLVPPTILHALTDGARGEAPPAEAAEHVRAVADAWAEPLADALALRYIVDTRLTLTDAVQLAMLENPIVGGGLLDFTRLTDAERDEYRSAWRALQAAAALITRAGPLGAHEVPQPPDRLAVDLNDGAPPVTFTEEDWAWAVARWRQDLARPEGVAVTVTPHGVAPPAYGELPSARRAGATWERLQRKATLSADECAARLRDETAARGVPSLSAWLAAAGFGADEWPRLWLRVWRALEEVADHEERKALIRRTQDAERAAAAERAAREAAEAKAVRVQRQLRRAKLELRGLADHTVLPGQLITSGYARGAHAAELARVERGELLPADDNGATLEALRRGAEVFSSDSQLGRLSPAEVRALVGVFRLFTSAGDAGHSLPGGPLTVEARQLYEAAGITSRRDADKRRVFEALRACSARELYLALRAKTDDGRNVVMGDRAHPFTMRPVWTGSDDGRRKLSDEEADALAAEWATLGARGGEWGGALPDAYVLELPAIMRPVWRRLVLSGDVLERLDTGARSARGRTESFSLLDWRLWVEVTQRVQPTQKSADGSRLLSYVDREAVLADVYGADTLAKARAGGSFKRVHVAQYEKAVAVLAAGDVATRSARDHQTADGEVRDVFAVNPAVMLNDRAALAPGTPARRPRRRPAARRKSA